MKQRENTLSILKTWGIACSIFLIIAVLSIGFIFAPVQVVTEIGGNTLTEVLRPTGISGGIIMAHSWEKYPNYIIGLGVTAILGFGGAVYCFYMIDKTRREDNDEDNTNINNS